VAEFETEVVDQVLVCRLARPERRNALTDTLVAGLVELWDRIDADDRVRAVVVTGEGSSFCAGGDLSELEQRRSEVAARADRPEPEEPDGERVGRLALRIYRGLKPTIAAINGHAIGSGLTLTLPMDIRVASSTALLGFPFTQRGLTPEGCSTWFLPRLVGMPRAADWLCSGRLFDAEEALGSGLVRSLHPGEAVLDAGVELAHRLVQGSSPVAVAATLRLLRTSSARAAPEDVHAAESRYLRWRQASADFAEGLAALGERRRPEFAQEVAGVRFPPVR
jgi:enoyl-CoA hydratase/carnithine racemase